MKNPSISHEPRRSGGSAERRHAHTSQYSARYRDAATVHGPHALPQLDVEALHELPLGARTAESARNRSQRLADSAVRASHAHRFKDPMRGFEIVVTPYKLILLLAIVLGVFTGCESTGGGGSVSGGMYYGVGFYDPWYYGGYDDDIDVIVTPPERPDAPVRPEHPIARPPASTPRPTPMPSIPSAPRPMPRVGGGRR